MSQITTLDTLQIVVFSLFDEKSNKREDYGIPIDQVREIRPLETITTMPNTDEYVKGIMNLRGKVIPVIDVKQKIGLARLSKTNTRSRILVADYEGELAGLLIDEANQVMRVSLKDLEEIHSDSLSSMSYMKGIIKVEGRLIALLDVSKLLSKEES